MPEHDAGALEFTHGPNSRRPCRHQIFRNTHGKARVSAEMLVGKEQHRTVFAGPLKRPVENTLGVGGGANHTAVAADEILQVGAGVHVGHGNEKRLALRGRCFGVLAMNGVMETRGFKDLLPCNFNFAECGHVGH